MKFYMAVLSRPINKFNMKTTWRWLVRRNSDTPLQVAARFRRIMYRENNISRLKLFIYKLGSGGYVVVRKIYDWELNDTKLGDVKQYKKYLKHNHMKWRKTKKRKVRVKGEG